MIHKHLLCRIQEVLRNKDTLRCCFSFFKKTPTVCEKEKREENHVATSRPDLPAAGIARKLRNRRRRHSEIRAGVLDCGGDCCSSGHTCHRSNLHQVPQSFAVYGLINHHFFCQRRALAVEKTNKIRAQRNIFGCNAKKNYGKK